MYKYKEFSPFYKYFKELFIYLSHFYIAFMEKEDKIRIITDSYRELRSRRVVKFQKEFAALLGISEKSLSAAKNGDERYLTDSLIDKVEDLLREHAPESSLSSSPAHKNYEPTLVPTIPYKVYNETNINLMEYVATHPVPSGPAIAQFAQTDLHMFVANDEMKPHLRAGDVLSLKQVPADAPIINGEIYVINSQYLGVTIRFLYDRGDYFELKSSNEWYEPFTLPRDQVFHIFRILGLVRTNI